MRFVSFHEGDQSTAILFEILSNRQTKPCKNHSRRGLLIENDLRKDWRVIYSSFTLTWLMTNDFQVKFFSFSHRRQWKLSVCKKVINQVRVNALYYEQSRYYVLQ